jgi:hypothetical protein
MPFEGHFEDGEKFLYGALNVGGMGIPYYGKFSVILGNNSMLSFQSAYLPADSAQHYVSGETPRVDEDKLYAEVSSHLCRAIMTTVKHADECCTISEENWPTMVCSDESYLEAIFVGNVVPAVVTEFRVERIEYERLAELVIKEKMGQLDGAEKSEVKEFTDAMALLVKLGFQDRLVEV